MKLLTRKERRTVFSQNRLIKEEDDAFLNQYSKVGKFNFLMESKKEKNILEFFKVR